ncbi:MAG: transglutaminase family protein [Phycisphaerae bacterium]
MAGQVMAIPANSLAPDRGSLIASHLWVVLAGVVFGLLAATGRAKAIDPDNPPMGLFSDEWLVIRLADQQAGYAHTTLSREGDQVIARTVTVVSMRRGQAELRIDVMESSTETVSGKPISFESVQRMAAMTTTVKGQVRDGQVHIEKSQFGMTQSMTVPYPEGALMGWGLFAEQLRRGLAEGLAYQVSAYMPSLRLDGAVAAGIVIGGKETIELLDGPAQGVRVKTTMSSPSGTMEMTGWIDAEGNVLKTQLEMMGLTFEMIRSDKATATAQLEAPEILFDSLVKSDRRIDRHQARRITYRLSTVDGGAELPTLPETGLQKPKPGPDGRVQLTVTRQDHARLRDASQSNAKDPASEALKPYLASNLWINSDDPQVQAMAKTAGGDADGSYALADNLRRYVSRVIEEKNLNVGFASASEVCRNKQGDCSEHAVLLAALGRARQLPSRVVVGLVYVPTFGGARDVFGFHMWTQFHLGGQWVDFDAAQNESDCNPTHIALATSSLQNAALGEMAFSLINVIGRLKIEVLDADPPTALSSLGAASKR